MQAWEHVDSCTVPGGGTMELLRHGRDWEIRIDGHPLMSNRAHGSEDALAELACSHLADRKDIRILIGGLGMGFTLATALRQLPDDATVIVAELVPAVLKWNQGPLAELSGNPLEDHRATVELIDVIEVIHKPDTTWDSILLDVDNGPSGITTETNDWLYSLEGLKEIHAALKPEGVLAVWSADADKDFSQRFRRVGFKVKQEKVRSRRNKGGRRHVVWVGTRQ